jgi:hypothetical protein
MSHPDTPTGLGPTADGGGMPDYCDAFRADFRLPQTGDDHRPRHA